MSHLLWSHVVTSLITLDITIQVFVLVDDTVHTRQLLSLSGKLNHDFQS